MSANNHQEGGKHYQGKPVQHWDFVLMHDMPYMEAQIFKYVLRWKDKNGLADLRKAKHFIEKLIEWELEAYAVLDDERKAKELTINELGKQETFKVGSGTVVLEGEDLTRARQLEGDFDTGEPQPHGYVDQD
jgi:hypothetical protein